jgi:triosephosphate isomerase
MNPSRRPVIAGNWKLNAGGPDGCDLARAVARAFAKLAKKRRALVDVVIAPPFTALAAVSHDLIEADSSVIIAGQNMSPEAKGAFTGEISAAMLKDAGARWVILGHSERRELFDETDEFITKKVAAACAAELCPIVCVGETLEQREAGATLDVVRGQVQAFIEHLAEVPGFGVIAYEPIWAIGTGKVAEPSDAQEVHAMIRSLLRDSSDELADATRVLYGGSVKADNAAGLFAQEDIDGALIGGASLKADGFGKIITAAVELAEKTPEEQPPVELHPEEQSPQEQSPEDAKA